jgi:hypothetical protein
MKERIKSFIESLWFNAIFSVISVWILVDNIVDQRYVLVVIWVVLLFHFILATRRAAKKSK